MLLALPAGAWADLVDRRRLLLGAQLAMFLAASALAVTTFLGAASPALVLGLTFALGCGNAVASPAWQAIQPDLVDRELLPQAAALNGLNMNVARAVGPAVGGFVVAAVGAGWVFALNAVSFVGIAMVVASWRPPVRADGGPRERIVEALRAGGRYVRHALIVRRLLYRAILFIPAASAVWALLPVVAAGQPAAWAPPGTGCYWGWSGSAPSRERSSFHGCGPGSARHGWSRARWWSPRSPGRDRHGNSPVLVGAALLPVGGAWIAVMSSLNSGLQLALPNWVRSPRAGLLPGRVPGCPSARRGDLGDGRRPHVGDRRAAGRRRRAGVGRRGGSAQSPCRTRRSWTARRRRTGPPLS